MQILLFALIFELSWEQSQGLKEECQTEPEQVKSCPQNYVYQSGKASERWKIQAEPGQELDSFDDCMKECDKNTECQALQWNPKRSGSQQHKCALIKKGYTNTRIEDKNLVNCGFVFCSKVIEPKQLCIGDVITLKSIFHDYLHRVKGGNLENMFTTRKKKNEDKTNNKMSFHTGSKWKVTKKDCSEATKCKIKLQSSSKKDNFVWQLMQQDGKRVKLLDQQTNEYLIRTVSNDWYGKKVDKISVNLVHTIVQKRHIQWTLIRTKKNECRE